MVDPILSALPAEATPEALASPFPLKVQWVYDEWDGANPTAMKIVREAFPRREAILDALKEDRADLTETINRVFHEIRGQYSVWGPERESGHWRRVTFDALELSWVRANVDVLFAFKDGRPLAELVGPAVWFDPLDHHFDRVSRDNGADQRLRNPRSPFKLIDGSHRVSAWVDQGAPASLRATIYIGRKTT
jgi:hypothetical protein